MTDTLVKPVDMSPEAIDTRLNDLRELYALAMSLQRVTFFGPSKPPPTRPPGK